MPAKRTASSKPSPAQRAWLSRGMDQPGGKLPLFDQNGRKVSAMLIKTCLDRGWAEPWFSNPLKPDWLVCKLTPLGRQVTEESGKKNESNKIEGDVKELDCV